MNKKELKCVDSFYKFQEYARGLKYGSDCAYRALQVQGKKNYDINFGTILVHGQLKHKSNTSHHSIGGGYYSPYAWHIWNETDDAIYDSCGAISRWGYDLTNVNSVLVVDAPKLKTLKQYEKWLEIYAKSLIRKGNPAVVYIQGIGAGLDDYGNTILVDDDYFNEMLDEIDEDYNVSGNTETNITKVMAY